MLERVGDFLKGIVNKGYSGLLHLGWPQTESDFVRFDDSKRVKLYDPYAQVSWVYIAIDTRCRNIARPTFRQYRNKQELQSGPAYELFNNLKGHDIYSWWYESCMWWDLEGEFFWYWGPQAGIPDSMMILNPRNVFYQDNSDTWYYMNGSKKVPLHPSEFLHIYKPNPFDAKRGVWPYYAMWLEMEQEFHANSVNTDMLKNNAIPSGVITSKKRISEVQAREIQEGWERSYGKSSGNKKVAVLGEDSKFEALNNDMVKYLELKDYNRTTILALYGVPLKVVNATTEKTALSGKDSDEQYRAFWSQTLIPLLISWQRALHINFYKRFGLDKLGYRCEFDLREIPELQENEADLHKRLREDVGGGILTPNEARDILKYKPLPNGDDLKVTQGAQNVRQSNE